MRPGFIFLLLVVTALLLAGCLGPGGGGPSPTPTPVTTYTAPQLKYILLDNYNESRFFYCDPDFYPVGRGDEPERAVQAFPSIENQTDVFRAITARLGLQPPYSNASKLAIYREYKKLNAIPLTPVTSDSYSFSLRLGTPGTSGGQGVQVTGTIRTDGTILSERFETAFLTCPICLPGETLISTPSGLVPVEDIRPGDTVWTPDGSGGRKPVPVLFAGRTPVNPSHFVVRIVLSDGRSLEVSPRHPLQDGRLAGSLVTGDILDNARVIGKEVVPFRGAYTYDILPAGDTGGYWANGIALRSTFPLSPSRPR